MSKINNVTRSHYFISSDNSGVRSSSCRILPRCQVKQQNAITKAQFGFSLTQRLYDRFFQTATNPEFCDLLSLDWADTELSNQQRWQAGFYINTLLVDIFDTYDKTQAGFVEADQLTMRMNFLRSGMMKLPQGKMLWNMWKPTRSENL